MKYDKQFNSTIEYYNRSANDLIPNYETADMSDLYTFLLSHLSPNSKVLDIGFGSGRDLSFLQDKGFEIWGIDPSSKFVDYAKERFNMISDHFFTSSLPQLNIPKNLHHTFDSVIVIAVWMHLPKSVYEDSIRSICTLLKPKGKIILSYSITPRTEETGRFFEDVDSNLLQALFEKYECTKITSTENKDGLSNDRDITWITEVYNYDKF